MGCFPSSPEGRVTRSIAIFVISIHATSNNRILITYTGRNDPRSRVGLAVGGVINVVIEPFYTIETTWNVTQQSVPE